MRQGDTEDETPRFGTARDGREAEMKKKTWIVPCVCLAFFDCAGNRLELRQPPSLSLTVPTPPRVPTPEESARVSVAQSGGSVVSSRPMTDLRAQTLAIALTGDTALCARLERALPAALVRARLTRVLLPSSVQRLQGTVERAANGDRTVLTGELLALLPMRANTPAEQLLRIEVLVGTSEVNTRRQWAIAPAEMARYRSEWATFESALRAIDNQLRSTVTTYSNDAQTEITRYERAGGRYERPEERELRDRVALWSTEATALSARVQAVRTAPNPDQVASGVRGAQSEVGHRPAVILRAVLTDLRGGETWWVNEVRASNDDPNRALDEALAGLIHDVAP